MIYDKNQNIKDGASSLNENSLIVKAMKELNPNSLMCNVNYKHRPEWEARGWDKIILNGIQIKTRRPKWWPLRGKDFPIEMKDGNRPDGLGWFPLYKNKGTLYMVFLWRCCEKQENGNQCDKPFRERNCQKCNAIRTSSYIQVYGNGDDVFFTTIEYLKSINNYKVWEVQERGRDNQIRKVSGFTLKLSDLRDILVYTSK